MVNNKRQKKLLLFFITILVSFSLTCAISLYSEGLRRTVDLNETQVKYHSKEDMTYIFLDNLDQEIIYKGDYSDRNATKTMIYNGISYQLRIDANKSFGFYEEGERKNTYTYYQLNLESLKDDNPEAYLLNRGFIVIKHVEKNMIYITLSVQLFFIGIASAMFTNPRYFWHFGYFRSQLEKSPSKLSLSLVRVNSITLMLIIILFPLIRLYLIMVL